MVKILPSNTGDIGLIPGQGAKIPHTSQPKFQNRKKEKRKKKYCNKVSKALKNGPCPKKKKSKKRKITNPRELLGRRARVATMGRS